MPNHLLERASLERAAQLVDEAEARYVNKEDFKDLGIEPKIRPVVIALVAHGFPTQNSCEGHLDSNLYPWVRFQPHANAESKEALLSHVAIIHEQIAELKKLTEAFWEQTTVPDDRILEVVTEWDPLRESDEQVVDMYLKIRAEHFVAIPGYWLRCRGADGLHATPSEILEPYKDAILKNRQEDMARFGDFLRAQL